MARTDQGGARVDAWTLSAVRSHGDQRCAWPLQPGMPHVRATRGRHCRWLLATLDHMYSSVLLVSARLFRSIARSLKGPKHELLDVQQLTYPRTNVRSSRAAPIRRSVARGRTPMSDVSTVSITSQSGSALKAMHTRNPRVQSGFHPRKHGFEQWCTQP